MTEFPDPPDISTLIDKTKKDPKALLDLGSKLARKWAEVYVDLMVKKGSDAAKAWAAVFIPNEDHRKLLRDEALKLMEKRGIYRVTPPPSAA